ncbi:MAG: hypothetical protein UY78_C0030G0005 [Parcubacteria group bacterium GW2011_GWA1_53_13]|nr:MAG: hypothetical protein UY78_C0030G0005 [Parcubacteria group bacterium GW2011_GWA1_53_13]
MKRPRSGDGRGAFSHYFEVLLNFVWMACASIGRIVERKLSPAAGHCDSRRKDSPRALIESSTYRLQPFERLVTGVLSLRASNRLVTAGHESPDGVYSESLADLRQVHGSVTAEIAELIPPGREYLQCRRINAHRKESRPHFAVSNFQIAAEETVPVWHVSATPHGNALLVHGRDDA